MIWFCRVLSIVGLATLICLAAQPIQADLFVGDVTGSGTLDRFVESGQGSPASFADSTPNDKLRYFNDSFILAQISYSGDTISFAPGAAFSDFIDTSGGNSVFTLTNLNAQGDNWTGIASDSLNAATFVSSNTITIDYAPIFGNGGFGSIQLASAVPEPISPISIIGIALVGLARRRRLK